MTACKIAKLTDRAVIEIAGPDAVHFLQNLVTNDVDRATEDGAAHTALLTPQGKILFDFIVIGREDGFLLDVAAAARDDLLKRLGFYKLRADVAIADRSADWSVCAAWGALPWPAAGARMVRDPRLAELGHRLLLPSGTDVAAAGGSVAEEADYHAHRIACGVPEAGLDYAYGDTFPHEANYDQLGGVDFAKGCFVGQEVVSRMQHRGTARKRIVPVEAPAALAAGTPVTAEGSGLGTLGSVAGTKGLAMIRLDRAQKALDAGQTLEAGGVAVRLIQPGWARFAVPGARTDAA